MNRLRLHLPEGFQFYHDITVRWTDLNYGGHVGNDRILAFLQEARQAFLAQKNYTELNLAGWALIQADAQVEYKRELKAQDQIRIWVKATDGDRLGFDLWYKIECLTNVEAPAIAVKAKTGMMGFDYSSSKKASLPEALLQELLLL
jgi:acyl-CoA thioester hydrolase